MERTSKEDLKKYFETGDIPTQDQYAELIDALRHEDGNVPIADVDGLQEFLDSKATTQALLNHINDTTVHGASAASNVSEEDKANWNNKIKQYQVNETYTDEMGDIIRIYNGDLVLFNNSRPFTSTDIDLEMSYGFWTKLVAGAHTPEIVLATPMIVQRNALLTMVVKAKFLDSTSVLSIDGITTVSQNLDLLNDEISIQFNSPNTLGYHNVRLSNKAGQVIYSQQLQVADDLEIIPVTADWRLEGTYASEITVDNNKLYPNVEILRQPSDGRRSAFLDKEILGTNAIPENQNFELHFTGFKPTGYTLATNTIFGVKPFGSANLSISEGYSILITGQGLDGIAYVEGTNIGTIQRASNEVFVIKRVNGVFRYYTFDGTTMNLLHTASTANNAAMEVYWHAERVGGVENVKLIYNY